MLSLPRTTKAMRRICVNPSHCLIFHQSKHSYLSCPLDICASDRYNNAGCRVTLLCWMPIHPYSLGASSHLAPRCLQSLFLYLLFYRFQVYPSIVSRKKFIKRTSETFHISPFLWLGGSGYTFSPYIRHPNLMESADYRMGQVRTNFLCTRPIQYMCPF